MVAGKTKSPASEMKGTVLHGLQNSERKGNQKTYCVLLVPGCKEWSDLLKKFRVFGVSQICTWSVVHL